MPGRAIYVIVIVSGRFVDAHIKRWLDPRIHAVASAANLISLFSLLWREIYSERPRVFGGNPGLSRLG